MKPLEEQEISLEGVEGERNDSLRVEVTIDGRKEKIRSGPHLVRQLKVRFDVPVDYELDLVEGGEFKHLNDDSKIFIKGAEVFVSHVKQGESS